MANSSGRLCSATAAATRNAQGRRSDIGVGHGEAFGHIVEDEAEGNQVGCAQEVGAEAAALRHQVVCGMSQCIAATSPMPRRKAALPGPSPGSPVVFRHQVEEGHQDHDTRREGDPHGDGSVPATGVEG